eukprot:CAMPEP_0114560310 /NCGR_PEP_ID=MMETSP0114-20121206/11391_1 /TAXON_ID=31324 /ORGANISM="Goniomonas sp, Strain m" /LENGTH=233 /DNA_ID=CAMNT_0001745847 /DNA_START=9 /DNA_END=710 /DNA_ORIENTATION=-
MRLTFLATFCFCLAGHLVRANDPYVSRSGDDQQPSPDLFVSHQGHRATSPPHVDPKWENCKIDPTLYDGDGTLTVLRDVTKDECPWLEETVQAGSTVFRFDGETHGVITMCGIAVSKPDKEGFFELPMSALKPSSIVFDPELLGALGKQCKTDVLSLRRGSRVRVTRALLKSEITWLPEDLPVGTVLKPFVGATYGVISRCGLASVFPDKPDGPFFEVPGDALEAVSDDKIEL